MTQRLGHQDRIAVPHVHHVIELFQLYDGWDEFIGNALNAMLPRFVAGAQGWGVRGFKRMYARFRAMATQVSPHTHYRTARSHARHESVASAIQQRKLPFDFRARSQLVCFRIVAVVKLSWQVNVFVFLCKYLRHFDGALEASLCFGNGNNLRAEVVHQRDAFLAEPVGHVNAHVVPQRTSYGGKRDTRVSAGCFNDGVFGFEFAALMGSLEDVGGHAVLHATCHVHEFVFGEDTTFLAVHRVTDFEQRRVSDQSCEALDTRERSRSDDIGHGGGSMKEVWFISSFMPRSVLKFKGGRSFRYPDVQGRLEHWRFPGSSPKLLHMEERIMNNVHAALRKRVLALVILAGAGMSPPATAAQEGVQRAEREKIAITEGLVIGRTGQAGRSAVHTDAIEKLIVTGRWVTPSAGDQVELPDGESRQWEAIKTNEAAWFEDARLRGGYLFATVDVPSERIMLLEARGHSMVYVNGVPRTGDPYNYGYLKLPVKLKKGANELLFRVGRGQLYAKLTKPNKAVFFSLEDHTEPQWTSKDYSAQWGGIVVVNATEEVQEVVDIGCSMRTNPGNPASFVPFGRLEPLAVSKIAYRTYSRHPSDRDEVEMELGLSVAGQSNPVDLAKVKCKVVGEHETHVRTFLSRIDDSVQYYAVTPPAEQENVESESSKQQAVNAAPQASKDRFGLILSLHGAGVEAINQARAYAHQKHAYVVAPTNRRPFGFDWEDWGRIDAIEVLDIALGAFDVDLRDVCLTGHSMGGHGTWQVGVHYPDRFAAIGPSAGWISFWSYTGAERYENAGPIEKLLLRAASPSDTLALKSNYEQQGVYILHGADDDNVPAAQARQMIQELAQFHDDFAYFEQPGVGHWWDNDPAPGADCVDWAPMMDFFKRRKLPIKDEVERVKFATSTPWVSSTCHWATIVSQFKQMERSEVDIAWDAENGRISGTTVNVCDLRLDVPGAYQGEDVEVVLDGHEPTAVRVQSGKVALRRKSPDGAWGSARTKHGDHAVRAAGPFKAVFDNNVLLVYGTIGTEEENAWSRSKARYDAETFYYRGNGSFDVVSDTEFKQMMERAERRNVVVYGNKDTNLAYQLEFFNSPVSVARGRVCIGEKTLKGDDLACLVIRPRKESTGAIVGVIGGTGLTGMRLTDRLPYFVSGVAYPDCTVLSPKMLDSGIEGVLAAGFFGTDWSIEQGEFAFRDEQ